MRASGSREVMSVYLQHFRDNGPQTYWGHEYDLDHSRSRDHSIRHMPFPIGVPLDPASIFDRFQDIRLQKYKEREALYTVAGGGCWWN